MGSGEQLINSKCYTNILCKPRLFLFIMPITLTCIGKKKSVTGAKTWAINMLMNSFSCLFLFIRGGCGWSWVFRTHITHQPAPGAVIIRPNMTTFPVPRPDLQSPLPAQVSSSPNERPSVKTNHTQQGHLCSEPGLSLEAALGSKFHSCVSFTPPASGARVKSVLLSIQTWQFSTFSCRSQLQF